MLVLIFFFWFLVHIQKKKKVRDEKYNIKVLVQKKKKKFLKNEYLAELLDLSIDRKKNIFCFDEKEASLKLLKSPFIKRAHVKKVMPATIYVNCSIRKPIAWVYDFKNIAIDRNFHMFPVKPFFDFRGLPEIYLGEKEIGEDFFEKTFLNEKTKLALEILDVLKGFEKKGFFKVKRVDVSKAFLKSLGKREIVLILEHEFCFKSVKNFLAFFPRILRLDTKNYKKQLGNYLVLSEKMRRDYKKQLLEFFKTSGGERVLRFSKKCIDMRIENLAFIDED
jgi:hypothetical protein